MSKKIIIFILVLATAVGAYFISFSDLTYAEDNYKISEEGFILIKIPADISQQEYIDYLNKSLPSSRMKGISQRLDSLTDKALKVLKPPYPDLIIFFTDKNWNLIKKPSRRLAAPPLENVVTYQFPTSAGSDCASPCVPWTAAQAAFLQTAVNESYNILRNLLGPPFENQTVKVKHYPTATASGQYIILGWTGPTEIQLRDPIVPDTLTAMPRKTTLWHEMVHSFNGFSALKFNWGEPMAQFGMHTVELATNQFDDYLPVHSADYEQYNKPFFDSNGLGTTERIGYNDNYYTTGPTFWLKLEREYPGIIQNFNKIYYDDYYNQSPKKFPQPESDGLAILNSLINSSSNNLRPAKTIEGEPLYDWYSKQYPLMETVGSKKFGARLLADFTSVKLFVNYSNSTFSAPFYSDTGISGAFSYELINSQGIVVYSNSSWTNSDGRSTIDVTDYIKNGAPNLPQEKFCARVTSPEGATISTCYYIRGALTQPAQLGIVGTIGDINDIISGGNVTITPAGGQSVLPTTAPVINGGFVAPGQNNQYFTEGGRFQLDYVSADGSKKITKYITKDINNYYYANLSLNESAPYPTVLSSSVVSSGSSTINTKANKYAAISYYFYPTGKNSSIYRKTWQPAIHSQIIAGITSPTDQYSLYIADKDGIGVGGPRFNFGATEEMYISKWSDKPMLAPGETIEYKVRVSNTSNSDRSYSLSDPIGQLISAGLSLPFEISDSGTYNSSVQTINWPTVSLSAGMFKVYTFKEKIVQ